MLRERPFGCTCPKCKLFLRLGTVEPSDRVAIEEFRRRLIFQGWQTKIVHCRECNEPINCTPQTVEFLDSD